MKQTNPDIPLVARGNLTEAVGMVDDRAPFNDIKVRQALNIAINREELAQVYYGGYTTPTPYVLFGSMMTGCFTPYEEWPQEVKQYYQFNPERAKQLLAAAGYASGFKTICQVPTNRDLQLMQVVKSYFDKIGVTMEVISMEYSAWYANVTFQEARWDVLDV